MEAWDKLYSAGWGAKYPSEDLIRFVARNYYSAPNRAEISFLDLGCGIGSNAIYLAREGFFVHGIDVSSEAIRIAVERCRAERVSGNCAFDDEDLLKYEFVEESYDCAIDVCTLQHVPQAIKILRKMWNALKIGGKMFSMMVNDRTILDEASNPYDGKGFVRFITKGEATRLFKKFKIGYIGLSERSDENNFISHYLIEGEK